MISYDVMDQPKVDTVMDECVEELHGKIAELTKAQFKEALKQAIMCGDFLLCVDADGPASGLSRRQQMVYIPYRDAHRLQRRVNELEALLSAVCDCARAAGETP